MAVKSHPKPAVKGSAKAVSKVPPKPAAKVAAKSGTSLKSTDIKPVAGWLQDASLEVPALAQGDFAAGERELEFSVGLRQQEINGTVRAELRGRALVHAQGNVLALVEASYVSLLSKAQAAEPDLPQHLYAPLRVYLEKLLALSGHTPPLPASIDKIA